MRTATLHVMGTVASIAAPPDSDARLFADATAAAFAHLRRADEVFSPYKPDSPVSRLRDGRLPFTALAEHPDGDQIREVLALCAQLRRESGGAFDAFRVGDPPAFDPSGAVKGWAAEHASALMARLGLTRHLLSAGGDVRLRDHPGGGTPWRVGIADPHRPGHTLAVVERADGAVATSGTAERGAHVTHPPTGRPATALACVTVTGPDLALADGYATAALALAADNRPHAAYAWLAALAERTGYQALTVDEHTGVWWTAGMPQLAPSLAQAAARAGHGATGHGGAGREPADA